MCGLVGIIGQGIINVDIKVLKQLIYVDSLRGHHSTGLAYVTSKGVVDHFKKAVDGPDFLQLTSVKSIMTAGVSNIVMMAHNRFATKGGVSSETAHPFEHGDITLCHNGTLTTQVGLPEHTKFGVDSENIAYAIALNGAEDTIPKLKGAFALTWIDDGDKSFNIVRNDERPLWLASHKTRKVTYYASERKMLEAILERNSVGEVDYIEVKVGKWISFSLSGGKVGVPHVRDIEVYEKPPYDYTYGYGAGYQGRGGSRFPAVQTSTEILRGWRMKVDDKIEFYVTGVTPFITVNATTGNLQGLMCDDPYLEVRAYAVDKDLIAGYYEADVVNAVKTAKDEYVVVRNLVLKEVIDNDANNHGREDAVAEALAGKK